jgi:hypothetical protein
MASNDDFDKVMAILAAAYPMFTTPDATLELYEKELQDIPAPKLLEAARKHISNSKFFPTIAELRADYDAKKQRERQAKDDREWKRRMDEWKAEAISQGDAVKMLKAVSEKSETALVPARRSGWSRAVGEKQVEPLGSGMTDKEWEARKSRLKKQANGA